MKTITKLWIGLGILILLSPLGLLLPEHFKANDAWGEWGIDTIKELVGYVPGGLEKLSSLWSAPFPDYAFKGQTKVGLPALSLEYIVLALIGVLVVVVVVSLIAKFLIKNKNL